MRADEVRYAPMLGFGSEYALNGNWSLNGEYNYVHLGNRALRFENLTPYTVPIEQFIHLVKFGANYRFGGLAIDPAVKPMPPAKGTDWTGAYAGVQAGYAVGGDSWPDFAGLGGAATGSN